MWLKTRISLLIIGIILCGLSLFFTFYLFPKLVKDNVEELLQLKNGTDAYDKWKNLPIPIQYKIYFFNISNPSEVQEGKKPIAQEIGPYIYNQKRSKIEITEDKDTLSYYEHLLFDFDTEASSPLTDTDNLNIANLPLMAILMMAEHHVFPLLPILNKAIDHLFDAPTDLFLETTPKDFLFDGIFLKCNTTDAIITMACRIIEKFAPPTITRVEDGRLKFSIFSHKNNSDEGNFVINSGTDDIYKLGEISSWRGSRTLNNWSPQGECNKIVGTDAMIYPPFRTPESKVNIFSADICRSVTLRYSHDVEYEGISGHRYVVGNQMLSSASTLESNRCYCLNETEGIRGDDGCLLEGAMELWSCQGAPIVFTHPHFYMAAKVYQKGIDGLKPDKALHEIFVDLEPYTGTPLRGHKKGQFNIFYRPIENITLTENLATTLIPIVWFDEGAELNGDLIEELNDQLFNTLNTLDAISWSLFGVGIVLIVFVTILCIVSRCKDDNER